MSPVDFFTGAPSLAAAVSRVFAVHGCSPHIGERTEGGGYAWRTYAETGAEAAALAAGLALPPINAPRRAVVAVDLPNCTQWLLADFACALGDFVVVGLHPAWPEVRKTFNTMSQFKQRKRKVNNKNN